MEAIELELGGELYEASLQSLSKYGALIRFTSVVPLGAQVRLTVTAPDGQRASVATTVVSRIDAARAVRLGIAPGLAVRYHDDEELAAVRFARAIARRQAAALAYEPRKTRPMIAPLLSSLRFATKQDRSQASRVALQGSLEDFDAATLCSALEHTRHSGQLKLQLDEAIATIDFNDGDIVRVQSSWQHGPHEILKEVIEWTTGSFELRSIPKVRTESHDAIRISQLLLARAQ